MRKIIAAAGVLGAAVLVGTSAQASCAQTSYGSNADRPQAHSVGSVVLALNPQPLPPGEKKKVRIKKRYYPAKRTR